MKKLLIVLAGLACVATLPAAQAQTGRIAHLSHGGRRPSGLGDNFGVVPRPQLRMVVDVTRISRLNDSMVVLRGRTRRPTSPPSPWQEYEKPYQYYYPRYQPSRADALQKLREDHPGATLEGFDQPAPAPKKAGAAVPARWLRDAGRRVMLAGRATSARPAL